MLIFNSFKNLGHKKYIIEIIDYFKSFNFRSCSFKYQIQSITSLSKEIIAWDTKIYFQVKSYLIPVPNDQ